MLLEIVNRWGSLGNKFIKWYNITTNSKGRFLRILVVMCLLILLFSIVCTFPGLMILYLPRLCTFLILIFVLISLGVIIAGFFLKNINANVWLTATLLSMFLLVVGVGLLGFDSEVSKVMTNSMRTTLFSEKVKFPLGNIIGIAVDRTGRIYLGLRSYGRIQVYNSRGDFIKGWFVNTEGG